MDIFVRNICGNNVPITVEPGDTLHDVRTKSGCDDLVSLSYEGEILRDNHILVENIGLISGDVIQIVAEEHKIAETQLLKLGRKVGLEPLLLALCYERADEVRLQVVAGVDVNSVHGTCTPLIKAIHNGSLSMVKLLVQHGANIEKRIEGMTCLAHAARKGHLDIVRYLIKEKDADIHTVNSQGQNLLMIACHKQKVAVAKYLTTLINVNNKTPHGVTALMFAVWSGDDSIVKHLVECGARVNARDSGRTTALMLASERHYTSCEVVRYLVLAGAKPDLRDKYGHTALMYAIHTGNCDKVSFFLTQTNISVNQRTQCGVTPLMIAARWSNLEIVRLLLKWGSNPSLTNKFGQLAEDMAIGRQSEAVRRLLRDARACRKKYP
eukprot:TRINITY_DN2437_c0_g1_i1.p1 TRINITY_DN2437_c0_g1~~TRINITY_DN2437_c0_g1_i1.p1  ORF type:complete len:381 (+),score=27.07 TRINITY_DN2437_c0_g1_i1:68-1210(+)